MKKVATLALMVTGLIIALLPLLMSVATIDPVLTVRYTVLAATIFLVSIIDVFSSKNSPLVLAFITSKQALPFYLFFISAILSLPTAINKAEAVFFLAKDSMFFVLMLLLINMITGQEKQLNFFIKSLLISAFIITGFGTIQFLQVYLQSEGMPDYYLVKSTMAHRNLAVSALVLFIPFAGYGIYRFRKFWRFFSGLILLTALALVLWLHSRTSWIALSGLVLFFAMTLGMMNSRLIGRKLLLRFTGLIIGLTLTGGYIIYHTMTPQEAPNASLEGLNFTNATEGTFTANERIMMWKATGRMIKDQPVWGVGPGNWRIWFPKYGSDMWRSRQGMVQFQRPHNDYLWILAEQGIIGLLAFVFMGLSALGCSLKLLLSNENTREIKILAAFLSGIIVAYAIIAFFSFPRERIIHQLVIYSAFAIIFTLYFRERPLPEKNGRKTNIAALTAIFLSPLLLYIGYQRWQGEAQTKKMLQTRALSQWEQLLSFAAPIKDYWFYNLDPTSVPVNFYIGLANLNLTRYELAKKDFQQAYQVHPYNIHVVNNLANIYQLSGEMDNAISFYEEALEISPKYLDGVLNLVAAYFNSNKVNEAYLLLKQYNGLFAYEGRGDERYRQYLLVVLKTIRDNLSDVQTNNAIKISLKELDDDALVTIHEKNLDSDLPISELFFRHVE